MFSMCSMQLIHFFVIFWLSDAIQTDSQYKLVETSNGKVLGQLEKSHFTNTPYVAFKGIPFAKPPIAELRFKAPEPIESWKPKIIDALGYGSECMYGDQYSRVIVNRSEDCLYLNIFTPVVHNDEKLNVFFYVYGGANIMGSMNDLYGGPDFLLDQNIILVTINYRVGVFGFLNLDIPEYSGNMAVKDVQMALRWTYENIEFFGGDKNQITLGGHSAGSFLAHLQLFNAESRKYFNQLICASGVANTWPMFTPQKHLCFIHDVAVKMNYSIENSDDLVTFLKQAPSDDLVKFTEQPVGLKIRTDQWLPVTEVNNAIRPFILNEIRPDLYDEFDNLNITTLFTFVSDESLCTMNASTLIRNTLSTYTKDFTQMLPVFELKIPFESKPYQSCLKKLHRFYFENVTDFYDRERRYIQMSAETGTLQLIEEIVRAHAVKSKAKTFYWRFAIDSLLNFYKHDANITFPGTCHADELCYIFWCPTLEKEYKNIFDTRKTVKNSRLSYQTILTMIKLISNFIKYGDPAMHGEPISGYEPIHGSEMNFLDITNNGLFLGQSPNERSMNLVDELIAEAKSFMKDIPESSLNKTDFYSCLKSEGIQIDPITIVALTLIPIFVMLLH